MKFATSDREESKKQQNWVKNTPGPGEYRNLSMFEKKLANIINNRNRILISQNK